MTNDTISTKQVFNIFILLILAPITRMLPSYLAQYSKQASLISVVLSIIPFLGLIYILNIIFKNNKYNSLVDFFEDTFGKVISKIMLGIYVIWLFILTSIYIRYFAESFVSTVFPYIYLEIIIGVLLIVIMMIVRRKIEFFARATEVFFIMFIFIIGILFLIRLPQIQLQNIYPVTTLDASNIIKGIYPITSVICCITYLFFIGKRIGDKDKLLKEGKKSSIIIIILNIIVVLSTIGVFGYEVTQKFSLGFFKALKSSSIFPTFQGLESILVSAWVIIDFVIITIFIYVLLNLNKETFKLKSRKTLITPLIFGLQIFSVFLAKNRFELDEFIKEVSININLILCIIVPVISLVIAKIRNKI